VSLLLPLGTADTVSHYERHHFPMNFKNRIAFVTGGSSGLGLATAKLLAAQGAHVWLVARDPARLASALAEVEASRADPRQRFGATSADLAVPERAAAAVQEATEALGLPDLMINCAGGATPGYCQELDPAVYREMMDINYFSTVYPVRAVLPGMIERGGGHIVIVSSQAAIIGVFGYTAYGAAKAAVRHFSDVLRFEMKAHGIRVTLFLPPNMDTPGLAKENLTKPPETHTLEGSAKTFTAEGAAKELLNGVAHNRYMVIPGMEGKAYYWLTGIVGTLQYPVMDIMVAQARKQAHK
jgi:3-dehydrosphinganine reductase